MLSFREGTPIAAICGGLHDGKTLHITEDRDMADRTLRDEDVFDLLTEEHFKAPMGRKKPLRTIDQLKLRRALELQQEPIDPELLGMYIRSKAAVEQKLKTQIDLECGTMFILPAQETERVFIAGKSGSGKSCLAAMYMNEYARMYPGNKIYLISRHEDDKAYHEIEHTVIPLSSFEGKDEEPAVELEEIRNSLVVFDDCDNLQDKNVSQALRRLSDSIISNGRKFGIYTIWMNHQLMEYSKTRNLLNEANKVIFFNSGSNYHIQQYLKRYVGMGTEMIKKILAIKSRWTMLAVTLPMYVLHEHGCFVV